MGGRKKGCLGNKKKKELNKRLLELYLKKKDGK
jgi:hypothetical protein